MNPSQAAYPSTYRIRVSGRLDPKWSENLQGMRITVIETDGKGTYSELFGMLPDQAALMGVLSHLYNCAIPLLRVERLSDDK